MHVQFDWKRFWCTRGGSIDLSDGGFLRDPESPTGKLFNPELRSFDEMSEADCLALLGEPGIGKSWELERQRREVERLVSSQGAGLLWLNLRSFSDEGRLVDELFNSNEFVSWRGGSHILHIFLDSLDECLLRIDSVGALLADELPKHPIAKLRLRVACRTAAWPQILETALQKSFPSFRANEMAPLRRVDVRRAAELSGIDDIDDFVSQIEDLNIVSLAIKPVTLKFLLRTYIHDGDLPTNQIDLYERGCRILCEESNESRRSAHRAGRLSPEERLAIAARIAAVTQFSNRDAVYTGTELDGARPEDVSVGDLSGSEELAANRITVSAEAISEVLDTGLFSSRGPDRLGWAHQTYAEFLSALYCKRHLMPIEQTRSLVFHPASQGQRLVPQLSEIAAWMAVMDLGILETITLSEPEALLGAASASLSGPQRSLVVQSILDQCLAGRAFHLDWAVLRLYRKLKHNGLAAQLHKYLRGKEFPAAVRHVATDLARACGVTEAGLDLAAVALDQSEDESLRSSCAATVANICSPGTKALLRPLALGQAGDDPRDELKGSGLRALWPDSITAPEILPLITRPKQSSLTGTYSMFLSHYFVQDMAIGDIPAALRWYSEQGRRNALDSTMERLMDGIVRLAWNNLDSPGIATQLARAVLSRMKMLDSVVTGMDHDFRQMVEGDDRRRRLLLGELLPLVEEESLRRLLTLDLQLPAPQDLEWLVQRVLNGVSGGSARLEAMLVYHLFDWRQPGALDRLSSACQLNPVLKEECGAIFEPIDLNSPQARQMRETFEQERAWKRPKLLVPPPSERVERRLSSIENGEASEWVSLVFELTLEPTSERAGEPGLDVTKLPGWATASQATRERIIHAARQYADKGNPENEDWIATNAIPYVAIAGFQALALLLSVAEHNLDTLPLEALRKWIPTLVRLPYGGGEESEASSRILSRAYSLAPLEVISWIERLIDSENARTGYFFAARAIEACWDRRMGDALLAKAADPSLKPNVFAGALALLGAHDAPGWREFAESFVVPSALESETGRLRMQYSVEAIMTLAVDAGWPFVWPILSTRTEFARHLVESLSYSNPGAVHFIRKLTEPELGDLYAWMLRNYPAADTSFRSGAMSPVDVAVRFRDSILEHLKQRRNFAACDAIRAAMESFPQYPWLRYHLDQAELLARAATWKPLAPAQVLALAADKDRRLVETPEQLVEVLLKSAERLNSRLQADLPAAKDLWNASRGNFWPKDEEDLSDYSTRHFRDDLKGRGIIVNREVQIRRGVGGGTGQSIDIHVDATIPGAEPDTYERTYVIIEVKGNWNAQLEVAMQNQLRDRYLKENGCRNGIYLVGWFSCSKWDGKDGRKRQCPDMSLVAAREFFSDQAAQLSHSGYLIRSYILDASLE
jgi:hypothetical protein